MTATSLPEGWNLVKLGQVAVRVMEKHEALPDSPEKWVGADHLDEGDLRIKRWSMSDDPVFPPTFKFKFPIGAVLIHSRNPKKVVIAEFSAITGEKIFALSSRDELVLSSQFLAYVLQSAMFHEFTDEWMTGSVNKFLNWSALEQFEFVLPSIAEQQRLIRLISTIDETLSAYQNVSFEWVIQALLTRILTDGSIAKKETTLGNVLSLLTDGSHFSPRTVDEGYPYVTVRNLSEGKIDLEGCAKISENDFQDLRKNGCAPFVGDVLFSKDGTIGRVAQVIADSQFVVLSSLAILRPDPKLISSDYLTIILTSNEFQSAATRSKTGLAIKRVVLKTLRNLPICVPSLSDQKKIVDLISEVRNVETKCRKAIGDLMVLRRRLIEDFNQLGL